MTKELVGWILAILLLLLVLGFLALQFGAEGPLREAVTKLFEAQP